MENKEGQQASKTAKVTRWEFLKAGGAVLVSVVFINSVSSCNQQESTPITDTTTQTTGSTSTSMAAPRRGGKLRLMAGSSPAANIGWPAEMVTSTSASGVNQDICETLLRGDNKGGVYPWLAESYNIADDMGSITFHLRKGVLFHDGSVFNADIAKWNLENYIATKVAPYTMWDSVDLIDDYTIRVNFNKWECTLPSSFAEGNPVAPIVSKAAFEKNGIEWMRANPVGTGAFKFVSFSQDVSLKEVRNPDYWLQGKPYLEEVEYLYINDAATQKMVMQVGDCDLATGFRR